MCEPQDSNEEHCDPFLSEAASRQESLASPAMLSSMQGQEFVLVQLSTAARGRLKL